MPNFFVWIYVAVLKKRGQPSLFSFQIVTTTKIKTEEFITWLLVTGSCNERKKIFYRNIPIFINLFLEVSEIFFINVQV